MPGIVDVQGVEVFGRGTGQYELLCGYVDPQGKVHRQVILREVTGVEEDIMDDDDVTSTERMSRILSACCLKLGDISDKETIRQAISDDLTAGLPITTTDRISMMVDLWRVSRGEVYRFQRRCPACGHMNRNKELDMRSLERKPVPVERAAKRRVEVELPNSGRRVVLRVLTAKTENQLSALRPQQKDLKNLAMLARIEAIEVPAADAAGGSKMEMKRLLNPRDGLEIVRALPTADRAYIREVYDIMEADLDTMVEVQCDNRMCGIEFRFPLDIGQGFFSNPAAGVSPQELNWL